MISKRASWSGPHLVNQSKTKLSNAVREIYICIYKSNMSHYKSMQPKQNIIAAILNQIETSMDHGNYVDIITRTKQEIITLRKS